MELWIRSQNKKMLTKLDYCYLEPVHKREILGGNHYLINQSLGIYPTEKRTLEVLNEIQNILNLKDMYKYDRELVLKSCENIDEEQVKIVRQQMSVYEMPKK